jgi:hypothetical protein
MNMEVRAAGSLIDLLIMGRRDDGVERDVGRLREST